VSINRIIYLSTAQAGI